MVMRKERIILCVTISQDGQGFLQNIQSIDFQNLRIISAILKLKFGVKISNSVTNFRRSSFTEPINFYIWINNSME